MHKINSLLIIDDDRDDQDLLIEIVNEIDSSIECAGAIKCEQALSMLQNRLDNLPGYIFLDLNLPGIDGRECLKILKEDASFKNIPVAIYSTSSSERDKKETADLGADCFITKGSSIASIRKEIESVLSLKFNGRG